MKKNDKNVGRGRARREETDRAEAVAGIRRGLAEAAQGRTRPAREVFAALREKYKIPPH